MPDPRMDTPVNFGGYKLGKELGRGAFGIVYACVRESTGENFAAKAVDLRRLKLSCNVKVEVKRLQSEAKVLQRVPPHVNLVRFVEVLQEGEWLTFILELVTGGDLYSALVNLPCKGNKRPRFRETEARHIFRQLVNGLTLLHDQGIIHRDLKLENVLVARRRAVRTDVLLDIKIADFGLSKVTGEGHSEARSTVGSPRYMAPEIHASSAHDCRADLWSLGVLCYVLLSGQFPCQDGAGSVDQASLNSKVDQLNCSAEAQETVRGLLQKRPEARLSIEQLRRLPWLGKGGAITSSQGSNGSTASAASTVCKGRPNSLAAARPLVPRLVRRLSASTSTSSCKSKRPAVAGRGANGAGSRASAARGVSGGRRKAASGSEDAASTAKRLRSRTGHGASSAERLLFGRDEDAKVSRMTSQLEEAMASL